MQQTYEGMDHRVTVVRVRNGQMLEIATEFVHGLDDVFQSGPKCFWASPQRRLLSGEEDNGLLKAGTLRQWTQA